MNNNITLVVMAAGMGSRFGGLKQIEPIGKNGEILLDYSVYDAVKAGFNKVVFVIKHAIEADFKAVVGKRIEKMVKTEYVFQETDALPEGFEGVQSYNTLAQRLLERGLDGKTIRNIYWNNTMGVMDRAVRNYKK